MNSPSSHNSPRKSRARNYLGRREQVRLLMLVGSLMLVIILMNEARKPKNWVWLTRLRGEQLAETDESGEEIDTRALLAGVKTEATAPVPEMIVEPAFRFECPSELDDDQLAFQRTENDFWRQQLELLHWRERRLLPQVLKAVRDNQPLSPEDARAWAETLDLLDQRWTEYTQQAMDRVTLDMELSDQDRGTWLTILQQLRTQWDSQLHDALAAAAEPSTLTQDQRDQIDRFQSLFDELSLSAITDGTVVSRPKEANAWFRLFENLNQTDQQALAASDAAEVGFRQLYQQSDDYRGKLVRVRGEARRVYHLRAPKNIAGVEGYYKFIIALDGHIDDPVFVYALELPEGFPEVKDLDVDKEVTDLIDVDVEFTGYFFKCTAYQAGDGTRVAPLILAKAPTWTPKPPRGDPPPPNMWLLLAAVVGTALIGTAIAAFVMSRHQDVPSDAYTASARANPQQFAELNEHELLAEPGERLRNLAQDDAAAETKES